MGPTLLLSPAAMSSVFPSRRTSNDDDELEQGEIVKREKIDASAEGIVVARAFAVVSERALISLMNIHSHYVVLFLRWFPSCDIFAWLQYISVCFRSLTILPSAFEARFFAPPTSLLSTESVSESFCS